jgi:hypothetical protein
MPETPWAPYVTLRSEPIRLTFGRVFVTIELGSGAVCRLVRGSRVIKVRSKDGVWQSPEVYRLPRLSWDGSTAVPVVRLHPFAVPHLVWSGQLPEAVVTRIVSELGSSPTTELAFLETRQCPLLTGDGRPYSYRLAIATNYNYEVVGSC